LKANYFHGKQISQILLLKAIFERTKNVKNQHHAVATARFVPNALGKHLPAEMN